MQAHPSAEKRARQTIKRTAVNKNRRSQIRSAVRKVEEAIAAGDKGAAAAALKLAEPALMRGVSKGDRKSTRLNSSHTVISYAVFCLKKKKKKNEDEAFWSKWICIKKRKYV